MVTKTIPRRGKRLEFAVNEKFQESARKRILLDISRRRRDAEREIRKADKLTAYFERSMAEIRAEKHTSVADALWNAYEFGSHYAVARLLGLWNVAWRPHGLRDLVLDVLFGIRNAPAPRWSKQTRAAEPATALATVDALAEAARIASEARDASIEIDWTQNPASDRERELRAAIIRRIENDVKENYGRWGWPLSSTASSIRCHLEELAPDADIVGSDLYDAIENWGAICDREREKERAAKKQRIREQAIRDLNGVAQ